MSRARAKTTKPKQRYRSHSPAYIMGAWLASVLSVGLLYLAGKAFMSDLASFRSCSANSSGLSIVSCGKQSPNVGDLVIFGLFALAAILTVSLFSMAWRATRGEVS